MSTVEFEEPKFNFDRRVPIPEVKSGPIIRIIIKTGVAKKPASINTVMVSISLFCVLLSLVLVNIFVFRDEKIYREDLSEADLRVLPPDIINELPSKND